MIDTLSLIKNCKSTYARSRRRRVVLVGICLVAMALLVWLDRSVIGPKWTGRLASQEQASTDDVARYHAKTFSVVRVIDADTLQIDAPDGRDPTTTVRFLGIDAPEMGDAETEPVYFARQSAEFARGLALGKDVTLYLDEGGDSRGYYGRLLAYIELPDGAFLNEMLVYEGYAYADLRFRHSYYQKYRQLEASARALGKGLWAEVSREQLPPWLQRMQPELLTQP